MLITDVNENEIVEGDRVESLYEDSDGELGTVESFDHNGWLNVEFDAQPGNVFTLNPTRVMKVEA